MESRRLVFRIKKLGKGLAKPLAGKVKVFLRENPALHDRFVQIARKLGLYPLLNKLLNKAVVSDSNKPGSGHEPKVSSPGLAYPSPNEPSMHDPVVAEQNLDTEEVYHALEDAITKAERH
jgi:hypothetical protein